MSAQCIYYVYAYINSKTMLPYYIGKGKGKRAYTYHGTVSVPKNRNFIVFLETNLSEIGALAIERRMIRWYGRECDGSGILKNLTAGGEGVSMPGHLNNMFGKFHTEDSKFTMSQNRKGKYSGKDNHMFGKKGELHPSFGKSYMTEEQRRSASARMKNRNIDEKELQRIRESNLMRAATKYTCPHCGKLVDMNNFGRWHGNKCKLFIGPAMI